MAKFIVFVHSLNSTTQAGQLVHESKAKELLKELTDTGLISTDYEAHDFESVVEALEYGHNELLLNIVTADKHRRAVGLSIMAAASEVDSSDLIADLQRARKVLEDRQQ